MMTFPSSSSPRIGSYFPLGAVILALIVVFVRGGVLLTRYDRLTADPDGYRALARNVAEQGVLGSGQKPSAYRPPLYPLVLAACTAGPWEAETAIALVHLAIGLATVWLTVYLGHRWGLGSFAYFAGALVACDPILLNQSTLVMTETLATFLAVTALALTSAAADTTGRQRAMLAALTGSGFALAALCRPTFLASLLLMAAGILYVLQSWRERLQTLAAMCVAASLVLLPWAARNFIDFGKPIVTTTHGGYTLLLGNNPAYYDFLHTAPWRAVWSADQLDAGLLAQRSSDEVTNDRREYELAWQTIREQPTMFLYATLRRITALWGVLPHQVTDGESSRARWGRYAVAIWYVTVFALAIAALAPGRSSVGNALRGVPSNANRRPSGSPGTPQRAFPTEAHNNACTQMNVAAVAIARPPWLWAALLIASFTAVHLLYWTDMRMRAPLVPAVSLLAAAGCKRLTALCQNTQTPVS